MAGIYELEAAGSVNHAEVKRGLAIDFLVRTDETVDVRELRSARLFQVMVEKVPCSKAVTRAAPTSLPETSASMFTKPLTEA